MIIAAALGPAPPLLLPGLTGAAQVLPELRRAGLDAVSELVAGGPDLVAVVGADESTAVWDPAARVDVLAYAPGLAGVVPGGPGGGLPVSLGVGGWLLDLAGYAGRRLLRSVGSSEPVDSCAQVGRELAALPGRVALLVLGEGSACRGLKAPGYFDERSAGFDGEVERAVRTGELDALLALDSELARELMAAGRPAWQVLAGALEGKVVESEIRYCDDPFGVAYLVASMRV
ncbi:MAG TPA: hypothetical protein VFI65_15090 [Streptosporangiaceae bacterium]|nr:hypothetical protein [Streptosporangiaceae bacterium]